MPDIKEKLVELIKQVESAYVHGDVRDCIADYLAYGDASDKIADHLISNGVTIQQWISVEERKPKAHQLVLVHYRGGTIDTAYWLEILQQFTGYGLYGEVTHWMPLPEPPKGEYGAP